MVTGLVIGGVFLVGVGLYAYGVARQSKSELAIRQAAMNEVNAVVSSLHSATDTIKSKLHLSGGSGNVDSSFHDTLKAAMKENP